MFQNIEKMMMAGVGALSMTREKAEKMFEEYVNRGEAAKENKEGFVSDMLDYAEKNRKEFESLIGRQLKQTLSNMDLPTKEDLARVEKKIDQLARNTSKS